MNKDLEKNQQTTTTHCKISQWAKRVNKNTLLAEQADLSVCDIDHLS